MFELETNYVNEINQLRTKYIDMQAAAAVGTEEEKNAFAQFAAVIGSTVSSIATEYDKQRASVSGLISDNEVLLSKEKDRQNVIDGITAQMERQATLGDQLRGANEKMNEALFEGSQIGKSPMEQQLNKIKRDAAEAGRQAGQSFAAGFDAMDMSVSQANELAKGLEAISKAYESIGEQQIQNYKLQQTVGEGMASIMQNMNSAIDNFVTTGKFKFSDFARSVIQDLLKIELKAQASKLFASASSGISSFLGSLFGGMFAEGGQPPVGKPSIVGENGPELFVPKTAGIIVPNGGTNGAVAGNTYITNNISAIDAKSVAQLFAENRRTLFGSVQLAQKELSYGR
jgi:phage-related minor tail protein